VEQIVDISSLRTSGEYIVLRDVPTDLDIFLVRIDGAKKTGPLELQKEDGIVAYSRRCTHMSCYLVPVPSVSPGRLPTADGLLSCKCHFSCFDLKNSGLPVIGPATDCLAQMELKKVDQTHVELVGWIKTKSVPYGAPYGQTSAK
jgi:Rieske Fe-S protein